MAEALLKGMTFTVVKDNLVAAWKGGETPAQLPELFKTTAAQLPGSLAAWQRACLEIVARVATGEVPASSAAAFLGSLNLAASSGGGAADALGDALWTVGLQLADDKDAGEAAIKDAKSGKGGKDGAGSARGWQAVADLTRALAALPPFKDSGALERSLEPELLAAAGLVTSAESFEKKLKKVNTDAVYRQQKYNLLREETEGYAKLVVLLGTLTTAGLAEALKAMRSLIGFFDLDPNRVLSLVLEAYECDPDNGEEWHEKNSCPIPSPPNGAPSSPMSLESSKGRRNPLLRAHASCAPDAFLECVAQFKRGYLPHVLGFKLHAYFDSEAGSAGPQKPTPKSLYRLTARLLSKGLVTLKEVGH